MNDYAVLFLLNEQSVLGMLPGHGIQFFQPKKPPTNNQAEIIPYTRKALTIEWEYAIFKV